MLSTANKKLGGKIVLQTTALCARTFVLIKIKLHVIKSEICHYIPFLITAVGRLLPCEAVVNGCRFVILLLHNIILSFGEWFL